MNLKRMTDLYRLMFTAREIDGQEKQLIAQNLAHFHVSCTGHESMAVLAAHLTDQDWLHPHYRDKALLLARGMPVIEFFRSLLGRLNSHSQGRQMSAHFSAPELKICSMVGPVGNNALQAVGIAAAIKDRKENGLAVCSVGDGTTQQGEFLEAVAEAVRWQLPILFIVEDNRYSISTPTAGKTFFDLPSGRSQDFYGLKIHYLDGTDVCLIDAGLEKLVANIRQKKSPELAVIRFERLASHTSSDDHMLYRKAEEIEDIQKLCDPVLNLRQLILSQNFPIDDLIAMENEVSDQVKRVVLEVQNEPESFITVESKCPYPQEFNHSKENSAVESLLPRLTMREAITHVLKTHLEQNPAVLLYGQDIEDPKGDVFGVTKGLSTAFPNRVLNACLSESTIVGTAIGRALTGQRPVVFIQFADFLPLAFNQILSELGSMYWRSNGGWTCSVILMVTCGAYRPGLGPFHSQTMESILAHVPGIDVFMPSTATDAAGLLNAAFASNRPTVFLYPKSCLNNLGKSTSANVDRQFILPGKAHKLSEGSDLTLVSWGYPIRFCEDIVDLFEKNGSTIELIDLRTLSPWDKQSVLASVEKTGRLVVVHEDNHTCGFGAEILATVAEAISRPIQMRRIARPDTYVPYSYKNQLEILPSYKLCVEVCAELLAYDLKWLSSKTDEADNQITIDAIGSGPADEDVEILQLLVQKGDQVSTGDTVAVVEATKSAIEICATISGTVQEIMVKVGDITPVGAPLLKILIDSSSSELPETKVQDSEEIAVLTKKTSYKTDVSVFHQFTHIHSSESECNHSIYLSKPSCVLAGRAVSSDELANNIDGWSADDVLKRTGVRTRYWCEKEENVVSLAIRACENLFANLESADLPLNSIVCSTTTSNEASPSIACQVASYFKSRKILSSHYMAFDINAACSGYLYGLRIAHDMLKANPHSRILLITTETLSRMLNLSDPITAFLFGDAASATLITTQTHKLKALKIDAPILLSTPDPEPAIHLPYHGTGQYLQMDGLTVARTAYKEMANAVNLALTQGHIDISEIKALVPHPGSQRILQNVANHLNIPIELVRSTLADTGNTSSSSIPLILERYWEDFSISDRIAMTAFGAGFTAAATTAIFTGDKN